MFKNFNKYGLNFFRLMFEKHKIITSIWIVLTISMSVFPSINVRLSKLSIDSINKISQDNAFYQLSIEFLLLIALSTIISSILSAITNLIYAKIKKDIVYIVQKRFYEKLSYISIEKFEDDTFYNKLLMAYGAINRNGTDIIKYFILVIQNILTISGLFIILYSVHWSLSLGLFLSALPGTILLFIGKTMRYKMDINNSQTNRYMSYTASMFMNKNALKEIKLFNIGGFLLEKWSVLYKIIVKSDFKLLVKEERFKTYGVVLLQLSNFLIAVLLISRIQHNQITIGDYVSLIAAASSVQASLGTIGAYLGQIFEISLYNRALLDILYKDIDDKDDCRLESVNNIETIEIKNLTYKYPGTNRYAIKNINLSINKGEKIAIVGDNYNGPRKLDTKVWGVKQ